MKPKSEFIKCKFCDWKTVKWGRSTPAKAFMRLEVHIKDRHAKQAAGELWDSLDEDPEKPMDGRT